MKKTLGFNAALLALGVVASYGSPVLSETDEECAAVGRIAERVMKGRQNGVSLQDALDSVKGKNGEEVGPGFRRMVMDAYGQLPMSVQENKASAIGEFRDAYQLKCMKGSG
ncbi:hypothetical protein [Agrobacterium larrymoorei]|uniref:Uncharacterized protein n=1 Tax=Agrobacterium larrymoorei TaxID=160699 RepID=A0AAF0H9Z8_9HYPH|nr:hypothetical protein [Agrobacterium larrymoorei]WHA40584.1 hypothetical protein CFBP5477_012240 [Agrobacterium larrymoorei]